MLDNLLRDELRKGWPPGASVAVREFDGETLTSSSGIDRRQLVGVGSTTKVMTTTMIMQHLAAGDLRLDDPIGLHLPDVQLANCHEGGEVTIRQLLTHTSGLDCADDFTDTGDGKDAVPLFVERCVSGSGFLHRPGEYWSYCNCGFTLAGRLVEVLSGATWEESVTGRIIGPLGMSATTATMLDGTEDLAMGHRWDPATEEMVQEPRFMAKSGGPAGSNLLGTAMDLVDFADGLLGPQASLLPSELALEMTEPHFSTPSRKQGLAWWIPGPGQVWHPGSTRGSSAFLHVKPGEWAAAVVANGPGADRIGESVVKEFFDVESYPVESTGPEGPPAKLAGTYRRRHVTQEVWIEGGVLHASTTYEGPISDFFDPSPPVRLDRVGGAEFTSRLPGDLSPTSWVFDGFDDGGNPDLVLVANRLHRRVG